ncbi:MAG: hypothetical protein KA354_10875 [Phycisphaerae bacterium]|nr:hypothetical protein [Phycisphaerae bacterium]
MSSMIRATVLAVTAYVLAAGPVFAAGWSRNYDDGTTQGLFEFDAALVMQGVDEFRVSVVNGSLRMGFANLPTATPDNDSGLMLDPMQVLGDTSGLMLIKWSTNPRFAATPTSSEMNAGWVLRLNTNTLSGYVFVIDDRGYLQIQKLLGGEVFDPCPDSNVRLGLDPSKDWWLRAEVLNVAGGVQLRARAWVADTAEPVEWQATCLDTEPPLFAAGVASLVANEDSADVENWVDVDDTTVGPLPELICYNQADDDGDGLMDCADPDCAGAAACTCSDPFADIDRDGDVDQADFGFWQLCYTATIAEQFDVGRCDCLDRDDTNTDGFFSPDLDGNNLIDSSDFDAFVQCFSGPTIAAPKTCDD